MNFVIMYNDNTIKTNELFVISSAMSLMTLGYKARYAKLIYQVQARYHCTFSYRVTSSLLLYSLFSSRVTASRLTASVLL